MKINDTQRIGLYRTYTQASEIRKDGASGKLRKDEVRFSQEALELLGAHKMDGAERAQHLEKLKQQVSSGTYSVDSDKLAQKLLPFFFPVTGKDLGDRT